MDARQLTSDNLLAAISALGIAAGEVLPRRLQAEPVRAGERSGSGSADHAAFPVGTAEGSPRDRST